MSVNNKSLSNKSKSLKSNIHYFNKVINHYKLFKRKFSFENGVYFNLIKHPILRNKSNKFIGSHSLNPMKKCSTNKKDISCLSENNNKPNIDAIIEVNNIETKLKKFSSKSKLKRSISNYSIQENILSLHSEDMDGENEDFFFEKDNDNLIKILEQKIQNDILRHEKRHRKNMETNFKTVVNELESRSHNENICIIDNEYFNKEHIELYQNKSQDIKMDVNISIHKDNTNDDNQINDNYEIEDLNELIDFEEYDLNFNENVDDKEQSLNNAGKSGNSRNINNKTDEVKFQN